MKDESIPALCSSFIFHPPSFGDLYMPIHFGTDGWRAVISDSFTFDNLRIVTRLSQMQ
ncbi:hypothetical protein [Candidatus Villigracilis affinis]|uniref:hypothetical protein n=1 Tax=Candidatus Villigracilis affinis TaxID=3140682 RepID=UPI001D8B0639|nr:hypothetical protein [Anaerolineales bacterium]